VLAQLQQRLGQQLPHQQLSEHPDGRGIRVGFLSRLPLEAPVQLHPLTVGLSPVQVGDDDQDPATPLPMTGTMGRGGAAGHRHRPRPPPDDPDRAPEVEVVDLPW